VCDDWSFGARALVTTTGAARTCLRLVRSAWVDDYGFDSSLDRRQELKHLAPRTQGDKDMRLPPVLKLDLQNNWVSKAKGVHGDQLPASVMARWSTFAHQARRSRNAYFILEALALIFAASIPASAALGAGIKVASALGAAVVIVNGLRQIGGFHQEWVSSARARYAIESEIVLFAWGAQPYVGANAAASLAVAVEKIAASEGERFQTRRESISKAENLPHSDGH
jgi:hypothetical protein